MFCVFLVTSLLLNTYAGTDQVNYRDYYVPFDRSIPTVILKSQYSFAQHTVTFLGHIRTGIS